MTREEAIAKVRGAAPDAGAYLDAGSIVVDGLVALGLLELDEPKSAWEKFKKRMVDDFDYDASDSKEGAFLKEIKDTLEKENLKITEK